MENTCISWIHGKFANGEINTRLSYVAIKEPEYFFQGDEADNIILEINEIYNREELTPEQAFNKWVNYYL